MLTIKRKTRAKFSFDWYDLWMGVYIDRTFPAVYICPLPTLCIKIWREEKACCPHCSAPVTKAAYHTGDGWLLFWACSVPCIDADDIINEIDWPVGCDWLNSDDLRRLGFAIV